MFENEIEALIDIPIDGWTYHGDTDLDYDANVWFDHQGQPLPWDALDTLNDEYGVVHVESHSHGRTGSKLCVRLDQL